MLLQVFGAAAEAAGDGDGVFCQQIRLSAGAPPSGLLHMVGEDVVHAPLAILKVQALLAVVLLLWRLRLEQLDRRANAIKVIND